MHTHIFRDPLNQHLDQMGLNVSFVGDACKACQGHKTRHICSFGCHRENNKFLGFWYACVFECMHACVYVCQKDGYCAVCGMYVCRDFMDNVVGFVVCVS